jgi:hypothetical protein
MTDPIPKHGYEYKRECEFKRLRQFRPGRVKQPWPESIDWQRHQRTCEKGVKASAPQKLKAGSARTTHSETMLSEYVTGFGMINAHPRQNPASRNGLSQLMARRLIIPNPLPTISIT